MGDEANLTGNKSRKLKELEEKNNAGESKEKKAGAETEAETEAKAETEAEAETVAETKENDGGAEDREKNSFFKDGISRLKKIDSFKTDKKSFATGLGFYKLFWVFFIGCFVGVVVEVLFCIFVTEHRYESRQGVIYGPFNPVYGFGAIAMTIVLYFFRKKNETWIFIIGAVIGALFETLCSVYQEYFLGTVSWDYTGSKYSLMGGRTDLVFAIFWGILAVIWIKLIYPFMSKWIEKIPNKIGIILTWVLLVFMVFDCIISCLAVDRMVKRHNGTANDTAVGAFLDEHYPDEFLLSIYPNMIFTDTGEVLHEIAGKDKDDEDESIENEGEEITEGEDADEGSVYSEEENSESSIPDEEQESVDAMLIGLGLLQH